MEIQKTESHFRVIENLANDSTKLTTDRVDQLFQAVKEENHANLPSNLSKMDLINRIQVLEKLTVDKVRPNRTWSIFGLLTIYDNWRAKGILQEKRELFNKYFTQFLQIESSTSPITTKEMAAARIEELLSQLPPETHQQVLKEILQWAVEHQSLPLIRVCREKIGNLTQEELNRAATAWAQGIYYPWGSSDMRILADQLRTAIAEGITPNVIFRVDGPQYYEMGTPLKYVMEHGRPDLAKELLLAGADPDTTFHRVVYHPSEYDDSEREEYFEGSLLKWVVEKGAQRSSDPEVRDLFALLLQAGVNPNVQDDQGNTPIAYAYNSKNWDAFQKLLQAGASIDIPNKQGKTLLMTAYDSSDTDQGKMAGIEKLIKAGAKVDIPDATGNTVLMQAFLAGRWELVEKLRSAGASVDLRNRQAESLLLIAIKLGRQDLIKKLKELGADFSAPLDASGNTPLMWAVSNRNCSLDTINFIKAAVSHDAINQSNRAGATAVMLAAAQGRQSVIESLIESGASLDLQDSEGRTALMHALPNQYDCALFLIAKKARTDLEDSRGRNILMQLIEGPSTPQQQECVQALIHLGIGLDQADKQGQTPLILAIRNKHNTIAQALLRGRVDPNTPDLAGNTPLRLSLYQRNADLVRELLAAGADRSVLNDVDQVQLRALGVQ